MLQPIRFLLTSTALSLLVALTAACGESSPIDYFQPTTYINLDIGAKTTLPESDREVFLTIADLRLDGLSLPGFQRTTVNLAALDEQRGSALFGGVISLQDYNTLELVLDGDTDASGTGPGCYVLLEGRRVPIQVGEHTSLRLPAALLRDHLDTMRATVVVDLRRALLRQPGEDNYQLAANTYHSRYLVLVREQPAAEWLGVVLPDQSE